MRPICPAPGSSVSCWPGSGLGAGARDAENTMLRAELAAALDRERRLELRIAELERQLGMDSSNSGTPTSKESIGAKERRKAERRNRDVSERERRKDRKRGGQPGHPGAGLSRDPDPGERKNADPPAQCSRCGTGLDGAESAGTSWAQVWDVRISPLVTEWLLPVLACPCCGQVTVAAAPPGAHPGTVCYGPGVNTAAVLLAAPAPAGRQLRYRLAGIRQTRVAGTVGLRPPSPSTVGKPGRMLRFVRQAEPGHA
jgi:hypothetical protein